MNEICKNCELYKEHEEECWFYWEGKKVCTQKEEIEEQTEAEKSTVEEEQTEEENESE
jgi:hypothetical protein